ncbi:MAG TPA: hypothetical protein EYQ21_00950 [Flavobacteriales bacterium]|jgi:hypothetical protein|nr:hypothetical protein [Flavobacteriales bacterium]
MAWDDTKKEDVIEAYKNADPTPETSVEIVKDIAEEYEESPNGVRMILTKAGVYIRKTTAAAASNGNGTTRVSKADAQQELIAALTSAGQTVDEDIISKLTGKAAKYFAGVISSVA